MWPVLALLAIGALDMWRRRTSFRWGEFGTGLGMLAGAVAVLVTWFASGGWAEAQDPVVLIMMAIASELALRGWLVERVRTLPALGAGAAVLAVLAGAIAEALLAPGNLTARIGAGAFGAGLGWMYVASGLRAPVAARLVFVMGALALQMPR